MNKHEYENIKFENIFLSASSLFCFENHNDWINTATHKYASCGLEKLDREALTITLDSLGRLCRRGSDFMRADDEHSYPITVYILNVTV